MKKNPAGPIAAWAERIGKSRTSTVARLHRLRAGGGASSEDAIWSLIEPEAPCPPDAPPGLVKLRLVKG